MILFTSLWRKHNFYKSEKFPALLNDLIWVIIYIGDEAANCSAAVNVRTLHISSPILAAKSPFFYKVYAYSLLLDLNTFENFVCLVVYMLQLFSKNGMRESEQRHVTLRITASGINIYKKLHYFISLICLLCLEFLFLFACYRGSSSCGALEFYAQQCSECHITTCIAGRVDGSGQIWSGILLEILHPGIAEYTHDTRVCIALPRASIKCPNGWCSSANNWWCKAIPRWPLQRCNEVSSFPLNSS